jgi:hypothetical protein
MVRLLICAFANHAVVVGSVLAAMMCNAVSTLLEYRGIWNDRWSFTGKIVSYGPVTLGVRPAVAKILVVPSTLSSAACSYSAFLLLLPFLNASRACSPG